MVLSCRLLNTRVTAINGPARENFPSDSADAFRLLRRWDVERARRYCDFVASDECSTPYERTTANDDYREVQLWFEQDFYDDLGPNRELPALPEQVKTAVDQSKAPGAWKYSAQWRTFIRKQADR